MKFVSILAAASLLGSALADWAEAQWFNGVVQIPLTIDKTLQTSWIADMMLYAGDKMYHGGYCAIDNTSTTSLIFSTSLTPQGIWFSTNYAACTSTIGA